MEFEQRRVEAQKHWEQRLDDRDKIHEALSRRVDASHAEHADMREGVKRLVVELNEPRRSG